MATTANTVTKNTRRTILTDEDYAADRGDDVVLAFSDDGLGAVTVTLPTNAQPGDSIIIVAASAAVNIEVDDTTDQELPAGPTALTVDQAVQMIFTTDAGLDCCNPCDPCGTAGAKWLPVCCPEVVTPG